MASSDSMKRALNEVSSSYKLHVPACIACPGCQPQRVRVLACSLFSLWLRLVSDNELFFQNVMRTNFMHFGSSTDFLHLAESWGRLFREMWAYLLKICLTNFFTWTLKTSGSACSGHCRALQFAKTDWSRFYSSIRMHIDSTLIFYSYHVVHFLDEGSTYIVADWWLVKDKKGKVISSYFPPSKNKQQVRNAILDKEKITKAWSNHPVRILQSYSKLAIFFYFGVYLRLFFLLQPICSTPLTMWIQLPIHPIWTRMIRFR